MKDIPIKLLEHYQSETTSIAILVRIDLHDGTKLGFTDVDKDIIYDGVAYNKSSGISPSAISSTSAMSVDNLDFEGLIDEEQFTEDDIRSGRFNGAILHIFRCNYMKISDGVEILKKGYIGDITMNNTGFSAEVRGLSQLIQNDVGRIYQPACDANLGDNRCGILIAAYTVTGSVEASNVGNIVYDSSRTEEENWFRYGLFTWTSGLNKGYSCEVKEFNNGTFELQLPFLNKIQDGDTYSVYAGCDKNIETCKAKFNNVLNFRGFPKVPAPETVMSVGD